MVHLEVKMLFWIRWQKPRKKFFVSFSKTATRSNLDRIVSGENLTLVPFLQGDVVVLVADRLQALVPLVLDPAGVWIVNVAVRRN